MADEPPAIELAVRMLGCVGAKETRLREMAERLLERLDEAERRAAERDALPRDLADVDFPDHTTRH